MRTIIFGNIELFDDEGNLLKSNDVDTCIEKYFFACPLCKKIFRSENENIEFSDYHSDNAFYLGNNECEHAYLFCYGNMDHKYCVEKITLEETKNFIQNNDYQFDHKFSKKFNYYFIQIVKITHLITIKDIKKLYGKSDSDGDGDGCVTLDPSNIDDKYFTKLDDEIYDYSKMDKYYHKDEPDDKKFDACNDPGFSYKCICEYCNRDYKSHVSGD
jgi:hypothetical protein